MSAAEACESLLEAVDAKRTDIIKSILDHIRKSNNSGESSTSLSEVLSTVCCEEGTLLHKAVSIEAADAVRALLMAGSDPGALNKENVSVVQMYQSLGNSKVGQAFTDDLFQSIASSQLERVALLLKAGVKTDLVDSDLTRNTALHWAASFGSTEIVQLLIKNGAKVNATNCDGISPLHDAIDRNDLDICKLLVESGADSKMKIQNGKHKGKSAYDLVSGKDELREVLKVNESINESSENPNSNCDVVSVEDKVEIMNLHKDETLPVRRKTQLNEKFELLWPQPKMMVALEGTPVALAKHLYLTVQKQEQVGTLSSHGILDIWEIYREDFEELGYSAFVQNFSLDCQGMSLDGPLSSSKITDTSVPAHSSVAPADSLADESDEGPAEKSSRVLVSIKNTMSAEAYSIVVTDRWIKLSAGGCRGLHYAITTFLQILSLFSNELIPQVSIKDQPQVSARGILIDLAPYGRVQTVPTFVQTIRLLSKVKLNFIYLYTRLSANQDWQLLYSPQDLIALDRQCSDRGMSLVPTLDIQQPCSFDYLREYSNIFQRLLSCFSDLSQVNIGPCLSSVIFNTSRILGCGSVFPKVWSYLCLPTTSKLLLCCNSALEDALVLEGLPNNVCLVDYGFQAEYPFQENVDKLARSGLELLTCPGTSAWNCLMGRPSNMITNIKQAAVSVVSCAGLGLIAANWTGSPALTHLSTALPGLVLSAGFAWNYQDTNPAILGKALSYHIFKDKTGTAGQLLLDMAAVEAAVEPPNSNINSQLQTSVLLSTVMRPGGCDLENIPVGQLAAVIQTTRRSLSRLQLLREGIVNGEPEGLLQELTLGGELLLIAARVARRLVETPGHKVDELPSTFKTDIANKLLALIEQYRAVWLSRYLPGGLQDTILHLTNLLNALLPPSEIGVYTNGAINNL